MYSSADKINSKTSRLTITLLAVCLVFLSGCAKPQTTANYNNVSEEKIADVVAESTEDQMMYEGFYKKVETVSDIGEIKGGIVPHHLLAGYIPATFFNYAAKQKPSVVVIFGPNHFLKGNFPAISSLQDWETPFGTVPTDHDIIKEMVNNQLLAVDDAVAKGDHSLTVILPFVKKSLPRAQVVPIIFPFNAERAFLDKFIEKLLPLLPKDALLVASIDFSHYQPWPVANFHDELSIAAIKNFDFDRLKKLEIDSTPSLYLLLKSMRYYGTEQIGYALHNNSAAILKDPSLAETTSYYSPYFTKSTNICLTNNSCAPEKFSSLLFFGDMMLDRNVKKAIDKNGPEYPLKKLGGAEGRFVMGMDAISANLEGPFANTRRATSKSIAFRFDPVLIPTLKRYRLTLLSQANNHSFDMGAAGFAESKTNLAAGGIDAYGSQYQVDDNSLLIKKVGDYIFAFLGLNDTTGALDLEKVTQLITKAKTSDPRPDFIIVNVHWGEEYRGLSNDHQRKLAHTLIEAGADVIIGHHPHVVEEMEVYKNRPIFYSLGNFIFDQYFSEPTQQGLAVGLIFKNNSISAYIFPLKSVKSQAQLMPYDAASLYLTHWIDQSRLEKYNILDNFNLNITL